MQKIASKYSGAFTKYSISLVKSSSVHTPLSSTPSFPINIPGTTGVITSSSRAQSNNASGNEIKSNGEPDRPKHQAQPDSTSDNPSSSSRKEINKSQLEKDEEELRQRLERISGGGGEAGLELENGKPVAMKRGVKENMFRLI